MFMCATFARFGASRSMRRSLASGLIATLAMVSSVSGQAIVDDTGGAISTDERRALFRALMSAAKDPISGQFADLTKRDGIICGIVNLKAPSGGYVGFSPFSFVIGPNRLNIAPQTGSRSVAEALAIIRQIESDCAKPAPLKAGPLTGEQVNYGCVESTNEMLSAKAPKGAAERIVSACRQALVGSPTEAADRDRCVKAPPLKSDDETYMFRAICAQAASLARPH